MEKKNAEINIKINIENLDEKIEKASRLKDLLEEVSLLINSLGITTINNNYRCTPSTTDPGKSSASSEKLIKWLTIPEICNFP